MANSSGVFSVRNMLGIKQSFQTDAFFSIGLTGFAAVLNYFFNIMLAQKLPDSSFGIVSTVISLIYLILIPSLSIERAFTKIVAENRERDLKGFIYSNAVKFGKLALLLSILIIPLSYLLSPIIDIPTQYLALLAMPIFLSIMAPVVKGALLGMRKVVIVNIFTLLEAVLKLLMLMVVIRYSLGAALPILSFSAPTLFTIGACALYLYYAVGRLKGESDRTVKFNWGEAAIIFVTLLLYNSVFSLDIIFLEHDVRSSYAALGLLSKIVYFGSILVATVMFAYLAGEKSERKRRKIFLLSLTITLLTGMGVATIYHFLGERVVEIMFKGAYREIVPYVAKMGVGVVAYSMAFMLVNYLITLNDRFQIYILSVILLTQLLLYNLRNGTLEYAVQNQLIIYFLMFGALFIYYIALDLLTARKNKLL